MNDARPAVQLGLQPRQILERHEVTDARQVAAQPGPQARARSAGDQQAIIRQRLQPSAQEQVARLGVQPDRARPHPGQALARVEVALKRLDVAVAELA